MAAPLYLAPAALLLIGMMAYPLYQLVQISLYEYGQAQASGRTSSRTPRTGPARSIGEAVLGYAKLAIRCAVTTIDQATGRRAGPEPLRTLAGIGGQTWIAFGTKFAVAQPGRLSVGDKVVDDAWGEAESRPVPVRTCFALGKIGRRAIAVEAAVQPTCAEARARPASPVDDTTPRKMDSASARSAVGSRSSSTWAAGTARSSRARTHR